MRRLLAAGLLVMAVEPAHAQVAPPTGEQHPICWLAGRQFSVGALIRAADVVMGCQADGTWAASERSAAGCLRQGELYAVGAVEGVSNNRGASITCGEDGKWR